MLLQEIETEITSAQKGSDIHGLVENMAYIFHLRNPSDDTDTNWFSAEEKLIRWCDYHINQMEDLEASVEAGVHGSLNHRAYQHHDHNTIRKEYSLFDDWMYALEDMAKQVLHQVTTI